MTATDIVLLVLRIEGIALALALGTIFGYALWSRSAYQGRATRLATARAIVARHLEQRVIPPHEMATLRGLSHGDQRRLFCDVAPSVGEGERAWLRDLASQLGALAAATADTRSGDWWVRLRAARLLTILDAPDEIILPLLRDREPIVRAQVAAYLSQHPSAAGIDALIEMLSDDDTLCRFAAKDALMRLGGAATGRLVARLRDGSPAEIRPMLEVACATATHSFLPAAVAHEGDARADVRLLVARLLRGIGGPDAAAALLRLIRDDDHRVRAAAAEALGYLSHWVASPPIAKLLDDPEPRVRLAAALALDQLGPTGELLLRRARTKGSVAAAAAAARILDDPSRAAAQVPA